MEKGMHAPPGQQLPILQSQTLWLWSQSVIEILDWQAPMNMGCIDGDMDCKSTVRGQKRENWMQGYAICLNKAKEIRTILCKPATTRMTLMKILIIHDMPHSLPLNVRHTFCEFKVWSSFASIIATLNAISCYTEYNCLSNHNHTHWSTVRPHYTIINHDKISYIRQQT